MTEEERQAEILKACEDYERLEALQRKLRGGQVALEELEKELNISVKELKTLRIARIALENLMQELAHEND